jgi:putative ABC transport system ATP-binding protein
MILASMKKNQFMIRTVNLSKIFRTEMVETTALHEVNFKVSKGEFVAIMGPSGCGKSTLLNILGLLDDSDSGQYYFEGIDVSGFGERQRTDLRKGNIGFIFQSFNLLPYLSALGNVELGQQYAGISDTVVAKEALARVGLSDRINHRPNELSGGEQQRVAVARALAKNPPLILADEPTGNLDSHSSKEIMTTLTSLHNENNITLIMITHDPNIAHYCQRVIHIQDGQIVNEDKI